MTAADAQFVAAERYQCSRTSCASFFFFLITIPFFFAILFAIDARPIRCIRPRTSAEQRRDRGRSGRRSSISDRLSQRGCCAETRAVGNDRPRYRDVNRRRRRADSLTKLIMRSFSPKTHNREIRSTAATSVENPSVNTKPVHNPIGTIQNRRARVYHTGTRCFIRICSA